MWKLFLFAVGFFAASFTSGSESRSQNGYDRTQFGYIHAQTGYVRSQTGYDQSQHEVVGQLPGFKDGEVVAMIFLLKGRFNCPEGQARAVLVHMSGGIWIGCYARTSTGTNVKFEDGDEIVIKSAERTS
jgi:hypothetical protein